MCRNCQMRRMLERMMPDATWDDIKARYPSFVRQWKAGYEPLPLTKSPSLESSASSAAVLQAYRYEDP